MILRTLELTNFRAFQSQKFNFSDRVTVIAGVNGRGKSSVLDALSLLLSRLLPQVTPAKGGYKYLQPRDIHHGGSAAKVELAISFEQIPIDYAIDYDLTGGQRPRKLLPQVKREVKRIYGNPELEGDAAPIAVHYTTDRAAYRLPKRLFSTVNQDQSAAYHGALFNRQVDLRDFMSRLRGWSRLVENNEDPSGINIRTIEVINRSVSTFLPGFSDVSVQMEPLQLIAKKQGQDIDLVQMSDGERALFAMIIDLCRRLVLANPQLQDPLRGSGVVLIDEVELHLHPKWQREIIRKLKDCFPRMQFILTTHSPFVIQSLEEGELISLDGEVSESYSNESIEDVAEDIMGIKWPQRTKRHAEMTRAATEYFQALNAASINPQIDIESLKERFDELAARFSHDPFYVANLKFELATTIALRERMGNEAG
jgi:predicted ATP-binding protein involved in virulence